MYPNLSDCFDTQMLSPSNSSSADSDNSDYITTPLRPKLRRPLRVPISVPHHYIFLDLKQIEKFVEHLNDMRGCKTSGCKGRLVPLEVVTRGMGGTATVAYMCDECRCILELKASSENTTLANNDINLAAQVAFITAGCTYTSRHQAGEQQLFHDDYRNTPPHSQRLGK